MEGETSHLLTRSVEVAQRSRWRTQAACFCVLASKTLERIAFYGLTGNLVLFLNEKPLNWLSTNAVIALLVFTGIAYVTSVFGGWVSDSCLGKFKTILFGFIFCAIGYSLMPLLHPYPNDFYDNNKNHTLDTNFSICSKKDPVPGNSTSSPPISQERCSTVAFLILATAAVGVGIVNANIAPFGADQVQQEGPLITRRFFNWYYWCINLGCLISLGGIAYAQQNWNFFWGLVIPAIGLVIGIFIFILGRCFYMIKPSIGSPLCSICGIIATACRRIRRKDRRDSDNLLCFHPGLEEKPPGCLDFAKSRYGGPYLESQVDDTRSLLRVLLIFAAMIPYWIVYFQMQTTFTLQALHMKLFFHNHTDPHQFKVPAAWLSLFDVSILIILIPIMDQLVYPALDKRGWHMSMSLRISIGMVFAAVAMVIAGGVEFHRRDVYKTENFTQIIGDTPYGAANVTVFLQVPQYVMIGASEVFTSITGLELAYRLAPRSMQGLIMGMFAFIQGVASFLGTAIIYAFSSNNTWFSAKDHGDINCGGNCRLDKYFFFLAGVQGFGLVVFMVIIRLLGIRIREAETETLAPSGSTNGSTANSGHVQRNYYSS